MKGQNVLGGILAQMASVMDGVDGDLARLKGMSSPFGAFFDAVLDRYADAAVVLGMTWWAAQGKENYFVWIMGLTALIGSFMVSYSWARAEASLRPHDDIPFLSRLAGRDFRLFLIMLGGLSGAGFWTLLVLSFITHLTVLLRIIYFAKRAS
ncbi:MAG: CDP-alcohol phosphatidyltransferase family protein [Anaerolineae bacterium]|nr:CDP-alcohol phosphatidyltransferase family protein [Anaerolineae bacterium]